jgi:hypothetical protein
VASATGKKVSLPDGVYHVEGGKVLRQFSDDELRMAYTALFYITNDQTNLPPGHPPTPAQTMELALAHVLEEELPEAARQDIERQIEEGRQRAARRQQLRDEVEGRAAAAAAQERERAEREVRAREKG